MNNPIDWSKLRADFPILHQQVHGKPLVYFDNAATSQKPRAVIDALVHYYEHDNANVHRGIHELSNRATNAFEAARTRTAKFINAKSADEIIFPRGTTESINLVAATWGAKHLKTGDIILLTELEHHSNLVPWLMLRKSHGITLRFLPVTADGRLQTAALAEMVRPGCRLVSLTHASNVTGAVTDVARVGKSAAAWTAAAAVGLARGYLGASPTLRSRLGESAMGLSGWRFAVAVGVNEGTEKRRRDMENSYGTMMEGDTVSPLSALSRVQ